MGKKSKKTKSTTTSSPWSPTIPYLKGIMSDASGLYEGNKSPEYFPGKTYAESDYTRQAIDSLAAKSGQQGGLTSNAQNAVNGILTGGFGGIADAVKAEVMPAINSQFQGAGRSGSGLHQESLAKGFSRGLAPYMLQSQNNQLNAARMAPQLDNADFNQMYKAGILDEGLKQRQISEDVSRYNFDENAPWQQLNRFSGVVRGQAGLGGVQHNVTRQPKKSPWQTALGLGLGVASLPMGGGASVGGGILSGIF